VNLLDRDGWSTCMVFRNPTWSLYGAD